MRIMMNGLTLLLANLVGILAGFILFKLFGKDQRAIQIPIASTISVLIFIFWCCFLKKVSIRKVFPTSVYLIWIFIAALIWNPVIFFPLHYFTQGYLSSWGNILAFMFFQIPTNAAALILAFIVVRSN